MKKLKRFPAGTSEKDGAVFVKKRNKVEYINREEKSIGTRGRVSAHLPLAIGIVLFLVVLAACAFYHQLSIRPMACYEIGPGSAPARWSFTLEDGTVLQPEDGVLAVEGQNTTVICKTEITESVTDKPLLVINANSSDCVFLQDGRVVYSPSGRYVEGAFDSTEYKKASASGQLRLDAADPVQLTMVVQLQGEENRLSRLPKLTLYPETINYSIWKPYREIDELLDESFVRVKKGVTLNMRCIARMTNRDCTTRDGKTYLLRREQAKEIRERYHSFLEAELKKQ